MSEHTPNNDDLLTFIAATIESMRDRMATKDDIAAVRSEMATKSDLKRLEERLEAKMEAGFAAVRGDIEQTHLRLDSVERVMSSRVDRVETELGRVRSVLYLLVKDRPDMLRLLGQVPGAGGEGRP